MPAYAGAGKRKIYLWLYRNTVRKIMKPEKVTNEEKVRRKRMRIRIKKLAALGFAALLALQLAACADSGTPAKSEDSTTEIKKSTENGAEGDVKFATIMVTNNDWAMTLAKAGEDACAQYGYEHITMNPENDIQKQIDLVQSCISQGVNGFYIQTVDSKAIAPILTQAAEKGLYVFTMTDMKDALESYDNVFFADYDHKAAGAKSADAVAEALDGKGKVGIIAGLAGADNTTQRSEGFRTQIKEKYNGIEVVNEINCDWDRAVAMNAAEDMITGNPDIGAFYCMGEEMAWGVLEAVQNSGKDIKVVTIDASSQTVQMVMDGEMYACIGCPPKAFSAPAVDMLHDLLDGRNVDQIYGVEPTYMTQETASLDQADY